MFFSFSLISMYFLLPETENRTLEDIEIHFSDNNRKLTDIRIRKVNDLNKNKTMELPIDEKPPQSHEIIEIKSMTPSVILDIVSATNIPRNDIDNRIDGFVNKAFVIDNDKAK